MYQYFFKISFRNLTKHGVFPAINILSLSVGLAVVMLICMLIFNERSFDKSFAERQNIYRINSAMLAYMPGEMFCTTSNIVGPVVQEAIPEVLATVRTKPGRFVIRIDNNPVRINIMWADADFFRLFDTPFLYGKPEDALSRPNTVAISEKMAQKLFGDANPIGEIFSLDNKHPMEVTAVYKDFPQNTSFANYQIIGSFMHSYPTWLHERLHWGGIEFETFCLLAAHADTAAVAAQMKDVYFKQAGADLFYTPSLQPLEEIHLYSAKYYQSYTGAQSDIGKVKMLSLLAVIILLVACINYMNLSTARAQKRAKEIGVSKTFGAQRGELIVRLIMETAILTFISFVVAFLLSYALLPVFNSLLGEQLNFRLVLNPAFLPGILLIWLVTTIIASSYPTIYLSGFPPLLTIRQSTVSPGHAVVRKILTVGQFAIAVVLIAWVIIIQTQIKYVNNKDIGFNPNNLISISLGALPEGADLDALINDYRAQSSVTGASLNQAFLFNGSGNQLCKNSEDVQGTSLITVCVDAHFIDLMQLKIIAGTALPERIPGDTITQIVLNRKAVEFLEMTPEEIIGKKVLAKIGAPNTHVCGVVENFNYESLYRPIGAFGIYSSNRAKTSLMLRIKDGNLSEQLKTFEQIFKKYFPNDLFEPAFPDQSLEKAYEAERRTSRIAVCFSILAIFVACLGVFGLTAFMAEQRTKEIGIRKVMGASINNIVNLFTADYLKLLLISLVVAIPAAWWVGYQYLQNFTYRTSLAWWMFAIAAVITIVLTLFTVSFQAIKAALANPVKSLKTE